MPSGTGIILENQVSCSLRYILHHSFPRTTSKVISYNEKLPLSFMFSRTAVLLILVYKK